MLISLAAVSLLAVQPCAAQPCGSATPPCLIYDYVYYQPGTGTRYPPPRSSNSGRFLRFYSDPFGSVNANQTYQPSTNPKSPYPVGGSTYSLAYVNVSGGQEGGITVFPDTHGDFNIPGQVSVTVQTGTPGTPPPNIVVLYVYFPVGGRPCPPNQKCATGASIDEFDEMSGQLGDDLFVKVTPDPSGLLTKSGNDKGTVDTTNPPLSGSKPTQAPQEACSTNGSPGQTQGDGRLVLPT